MNETVVQIQANIQWQVMQTPANHYVGVCHPMNLSMEADSLDQLHSIINETLQLLFEDLLHDNELEAYLREHGWHANNIPIGHVPGDVKFEVPWEMIMSTSGDSMRRSHQQAA